MHSSCDLDSGNYDFMNAGRQRGNRVVKNAAPKFTPKALHETSVDDIMERYVSQKSWEDIPALNLSKLGQGVGAQDVVEPRASFLTTDSHKQKQYDSELEM